MKNLKFSSKSCTTRTAVITRQMRLTSQDISEGKDTLFQCSDFSLHHKWLLLFSSALSKEINLVLIKFASYQQAMSSMYGNTPREAVVDSQVIEVRWAVVSSSLIHILSHVKMHRVTAQDLLPHVL